MYEGLRACARVRTEARVGVRGVCGDIGMRGWTWGVRVCRGTLGKQNMGDGKWGTAQCV